MSAPEPAALDPRVVLITAPDRGTAESIARGLVERRLAACVNLVPGIVSVYRWEGQVQQDDELLLIVKTRVDRVSALEDYVRAAHPYDVPELVSLAPERVEARYLAWLCAEAGPLPSDDG